MSLFLKWASLIVNFWSFQTNITILQEYTWKNVHSASSSGIWTHDLLGASLTHNHQTKAPATC